MILSIIIQYSGLKLFQASLSRPLEFDYSKQCETSVTKGHWAWNQD